MNERIFNSFKEYEYAYFPNKGHGLLSKANVSVASLLATRAIEKHSDKLKSIKCAERIRLDCVSEANHNLNRLLDKPGLSYRKYLFGNMPGSGKEVGGRRMN